MVPSAPGGGTDLVARMLAQRVSEAWGQPVIVENNSGGATTIGTHLVARAAPDGYTLLMTTAAISGEVHMLIANVASLLPNVKAGRLRALALPALQQRFAEIGIEPVGGTPEKFAAYVAVEIKKWGAVARDANIRAD